jgi:hypothetical protein
MELVVDFNSQCNLGKERWENGPKIIQIFKLHQIAKLLTSLIIWNATKNS